MKTKSRSKVESSLTKLTMLERKAELVFKKYDSKALTYLETLTALDVVTKEYAKELHVLMEDAEKVDFVEWNKRSHNIECIVNSTRKIMEEYNKK